ncbi:MAG TPA: RidA family protein [Oligoflexia bacterium]|nr:RidA family protein [Oligoflexia bacterium]HMR25447.1 RidA family protein [Oligoflexia bacterium]
MSKQVIYTDKAPAAIGPYSQAIALGDWVFSSGQIPLHPETGEIVGETIEEQAHQVFKNLKAVLEQSGCSFNHIIKATVFITDMAEFPKLNAVYEEYLGQVKPARSTVAVRALPKNVLVEIEAIAHKQA